MQIYRVSKAKCSISVKERQNDKFSSQCMSHGHSILYQAGGKDGKVGVSWVRERIGYAVSGGSCSTS